MLAKAIALLVVLMVPFVSDARQSNTVGMAESSIRRVATTKPLPAYPAESIARESSGVAVAAVASGVDGLMASVTVLEAPDDAIAAAVREALLNWEVPPTNVTGRSETYGIRGKVTFYFRIVNGRGQVANPEDLPGGPMPEPPGGPPTSPPGARSSQGSQPPTSAIPSSQIAVEEIGERELATLLASKPRPTLLDIRERVEFRRGHREGTVNIPRDELAVRGWIEIDRARPVVIDCSQVETSQCQQAARMLIRGPKPTRVLIFLP